MKEYFVKISNRMLTSPYLCNKWNIKRITRQKNGQSIKITY